MKEDERMSEYLVQGRQRKVRVLKPHTEVVTGNERWDEYHEWVSRHNDVNCEILDKLGRRNNGGWIRWDYWRCNNTDCGALALVSTAAVEDTVRSWLPN